MLNNELRLLCYQLIYVTRLKFNRINYFHYIFISNYLLLNYLFNRELINSIETNNRVVINSLFQ